MYKSGESVPDVTSAMIFITQGEFMNIVSTLDDLRINSTNILLEMTVREYSVIAKDIIRNNQYQRKRVTAASAVYSVLKQDLIKGCIMPSIVLAAPFMDTAAISVPVITSYFLESRDKLMILDGLQRTFTIIDLIAELGEGHPFLEQRIRVEIYAGINRIGILYRMLTLNTGQTPMSLRQQIEMLYSNYATSDLGNIELIKESDGKRAYSIFQYKFKDVIEGFNSYIERNELPIKRDDILENIKILEKISEENSKEDIFKDFLLCYDRIINHLAAITSGLDLHETFEIVDENEPKTDSIYANSMIQAFKRSQAITGFGAAFGKLKDFGKLSNFNDAIEIIEAIAKIDEYENVLSGINAKMDEIKRKSKKIGNAQRMFFQYYFRDLLNLENDSFKNPLKAIDSAYLKYLSQV